VLNITIIPFEDNPNSDRLNFTWECTEYKETHLLIKLNFTEPLYVSFGGNDIVRVTVLNESYFERKAFQDYFPYEYTMEKVLFSMMEEN